MLKKILLTSVIGIVITVVGAVATPTDLDRKTPSSKAYVDTSVATKQLKIPAAGQAGVGAGETVMTYTANGDGEIGERGLYSDPSSYNATADGDKLITASALKDTFTNLPTTDTTKLECANENDGCSLWAIVDQTAYGTLLPAGYTQLEYVESTGTQYVDTGIVPKTFDYEITTTGSFDITANGPNAVWGYLTSGGNMVPRWVLATYNGSWLGSANDTRSVPSADTLKHTFVNEVFLLNGTPTSRLYVDGEQLQQITISIAPATWADNTRSIYLFGRNNNGTLGNATASKIYRHIVKKNGTVIQDLIPAKNASNVVGMYDLVSGTFFTNAATSGDDFTAGPVVQ